MNKKIKLISICIIFLLCVIGHIYNTNNTNNTNNNVSLQDNNVTYAISLDGKKTSSFPARGSYKVQVECNNAELDFVLFGYHLYYYYHYQLMYNDSHCH